MTKMAERFGERTEMEDKGYENYASMTIHCLS